MSWADSGPPNFNVSRTRRDHFLRTTNLHIPNERTCPKSSVTAKWERLTRLWLSVMAARAHTRHHGIFTRLAWVRKTVCPLSRLFHITLTPLAVIGQNDFRCESCESADAAAELSQPSQTLSSQDDDDDEGLDPRKVLGERCVAGKTQYLVAFQYVRSHQHDLHEHASIRINGHTRAMPCVSLLPQRNGS